MKGPIFGFVLLVIQCLLLIGYVNSNCRPIEVLNYGNFFVPNPLQLVNSEGEITSSNFPNQYNQNEQCGFLIKGPENSRIRLQFTDYQINQSASFGVFDGSDSPYGGIYTPFPVNTNVLPPPFESNSNFIGINFSTGPDSATGWRLEFQINEIKNQPILIIDSATTTFFLAVMAVVGFFFVGLVPPSP